MIDYRFNQISCSTCDNNKDNCSNRQIIECLRRSCCNQCGNEHYHYPNGKLESRHCFECGAEWPVYK